MFVHRKVKTKVKDVDQKESVDVKIEETRRNLFHVKVSKSYCSEVETETSKKKNINKKQQKKHVNSVDDADIDLVIVEDATGHSSSSKAKLFLETEDSTPITLYQGRENLPVYLSSTPVVREIFQICLTNEVPKELLVKKNTAVKDNK